MPEDVLGGLHFGQALLLHHMQQRRQARPTLTHLTSALLVVGDAPCHGAGMHRFTDAEEHLRATQADPFTAQSLLTTVSDAGMGLCFLRLNGESDAMLAAFRQSYDQPTAMRHMVVLDCAEPQPTRGDLVALVASRIGQFLLNSLHKTLLMAQAQAQAQTSAGAQQGPAPRVNAVSVPNAV